MEAGLETGVMVEEEEEAAGMDTGVTLVVEEAGVEEEEAGMDTWVTVVVEEAGVEEQEAWAGMGRGEEVGAETITMIMI